MRRRSGAFICATCQPTCRCTSKQSIIVTASFLAHIYSLGEGGGACLAAVSNFQSRRRQRARLQSINCRGPFVSVASARKLCEWRTAAQIKRLWYLFSPRSCLQLVIEKRLIAQQDAILISTFRLQWQVQRRRHQSEWASCLLQLLASLLSEGSS